MGCSNRKSLWEKEKEDQSRAMPGLDSLRRARSLLSVWKRLHSRRQSLAKVGSKPFGSPPPPPQNAKNNQENSVVDCYLFSEDFFFKCGIFSRGFCGCVSDVRFLICRYRRMWDEQRRVQYCSAVYKLDRVVHVRVPRTFPR